MDRVMIEIQVTQEYRQQFDNIKHTSDQRKCRSWIDLLNASDGKAVLELADNGLILSCNTAKGTVQDLCAFDGVLSVTEMRKGILVRLSHKRLLWIPASADAQRNEQLMCAMVIFSKKCKYVFKESHLKLQGIGLLGKLQFYCRPKQGHYIGNGFIKAAAAAIICFALVMATVFVRMPFQNYKIEKQDAIFYSATYVDVTATYRKGISSIYIEFSNGQTQRVDSSCTGHDLLDKLEAIVPGTKLELLLHPVSKDVMQIENHGNILLDFNFAQQMLWGNAVAFAVLGVLAYAAAAFMIILLIRDHGRKKY